MPAVLLLGEKWKSVQLLLPPPAILARPSQVVCLALSVVLVMWGESDMMLWLSTLRRENGRVSLPRVAWDGGPPFLHGWRALLRVRGHFSEFSLLHLFHRVGDGVFSSLFPQFPVSVPCLPVLVFSPVSPVWCTFHFTDTCQEKYHDLVLAKVAS